jgi:hypothetical protein
MSQRLRLLLFLGGAAFVSGAICTALLWELFHGPRFIDMVVGPYSPWLLIGFPFLVAALTAFWASFFNAATFGSVQGALVAALTLVAFCALLNALHGGGVERFGALLLAAFLFFGWALVLVGAAIGWFFRRTCSAAL